LTERAEQATRLLLSLGSAEPFYRRAQNRAEKSAYEVADDETRRSPDRRHAHQPTEKQTKGESDHHIPISRSYHAFSFPILSKAMQPNHWQNEGVHQRASAGAGHIISLAQGKSNHGQQPASRPMMPVNSRRRAPSGWPESRGSGRQAIASESVRTGLTHGNDELYNYHSRQNIG
jgi:hypothetical protein